MADPNASEPTESSSPASPSAPIPSTEAERLADLYESGLLDSAPEESYDALARSAALVAGVPIALVTLIDEDRQWFKAAHGIAPGETARDQAFCAHAVLDPTEPMIVADARLDPRFQDNPFVVDDPSIRFYCGVPVLSEHGNALGTLCVVDTAPHDIEPAQVEVLKGLADQVSALIQTRSRERTAAAQASHDDTTHIAILRDVGEIMGSAASLDDVLRRTLAVLIDRLGLAAGGLWWRTGEHLAVHGLWIDPDGDLDAIREAREGLTYPADLLLHHRERATRHGMDVLPTVVAAALHRHGIAASYTVPIVADNEVLCAFELLPKAGFEATPHQLLAAGQAASEVGRWYERDERARQLREATTHDAVTGLMSRRNMPTYLEHALAAVTTDDQGMGLLFIGIDGFVDLTTSIGAAVTDELLVRIVSAIEGVLPANVRMARFSDREFVAMIHGTTGTDELAALATLVHGAFREPIVLHNDTVPVSVSIGLAHAPYGSDWHELLGSGEQALGESRALGFGSTATATSRTSDARRRLALKVRLEDAIREEAFAVAYQPLVRLSTGRTVAAEALVRWDDPAFGVVAPNEFIPIAEESAAIAAIGSQVRRQALHDLAELASMSVVPETFSVWVNVAGRELVPGYAATVLADLARYGVGAHRLTLEVTERLALGTDGQAVEELNLMAAAGIHIAVDDFGTGFTSLTQLKMLPLSRIKIDISFTADLVGPSRERVTPIVHGIVQLGHALGLEIVAEGVESEAHLEAVHEIGADLAQGYYLAPPRPLEALA